MEYRLSDHALKRMVKRGVKEEWVRETLASPDTTRVDADDITLVHAIKAIADRGFKQLRVIYNETTEPVTVVTVFFE